MKKLLLIIFVIVSGNAFAELSIKTNDPINDLLDLNHIEEQKKLNVEVDVESEQVDFETFKAMFNAHLIHRRKLDTQVVKDYNLMCVSDEIMFKFLTNNIKYAEQFNKENESKFSYQKSLAMLNQDIYKNKEGCTGKAYFYK